MKRSLRQVVMNNIVTSKWHRKSKRSRTDATGQFNEGQAEKMDLAYEAPDGSWRYDGVFLTVDDEELGEWEIDVQEHAVIMHLLKYSIREEFIQKNGDFGFGFFEEWQYVGFEMFAKVFWGFAYRGGTRRTQEHWKTLIDQNQRNVAWKDIFTLNTHARKMMQRWEYLCFGWKAETKLPLLWFKSADTQQMQPLVNEYGLINGPVEEIVQTQETYREGKYWQ